jgi:hypothetical protein
MKPSIGRMVHYRLSGDDVEGLSGKSTSYGAHRPAIVVAVFPAGCNLSVTLDGPNDSPPDNQATHLWVGTVPEGPAPGMWHWPERED